MQKMEGQDTSSLGGRPKTGRGGGGPSPDQVAFEEHMWELDEKRRALLATIWESQEQSFNDLFDSTVDIVNAMADGHRRAMDRNRLEAYGIAFALLGTVISTIAG